MTTQTQIARIVEDLDTSGHDHGTRKNIRTRVEATAKLLDDAASSAGFAWRRSIRDRERLGLDGHTEMVLRDAAEQAQQASEAYLLDATGIGELAALAKKAQREAYALGDLHQDLADWVELESTGPPQAEEIAKVLVEFALKSRVALASLYDARSMGEAISTVWGDLARNSSAFKFAMATTERLEGWRAGRHYDTPTKRLGPDYVCHHCGNDCAGECDSGMPWLL